MGEGVDTFGGGCGSSTSNPLKVYNRMNETCFVPAYLVPEDGGRQPYKGRFSALIEFLCRLKGKV